MALHNVFYVTRFREEEIEPSAELLAAAYDRPWSVDDLRQWWRAGAAYGEIARDRDGAPAGVLLAELRIDHLSIQGLAVAPGFRRLGLGSHFLWRLSSGQTFNTDHRPTPIRFVSALVAETNVFASAFLLRRGFGMAWVHAGGAKVNGVELDAIEYRLPLARREAAPCPA